MGNSANEQRALLLQCSLVLALPDGAVVELRAPVFRVYGEDYVYLYDDVRAKGCCGVRIDGALARISVRYRRRVLRARGGRRGALRDQRRCPLER